MFETNRITAPTRIGVVSTFPPTRCGIGRFSSSFVSSLSKADPSLDIEVIRLKCDKSAGVARGRVLMEIDPNSDVGIRAATRHLNRCTVAVVQHEFGIFGADDGSAVVDLVAGLKVPTVVVLHTVLSNPTPRQRSVVEELSRGAVVVVMCDSAARILNQHYSVAAASVEVIGHGAQWGAQPLNHQPRRELITWGLLGPGKGIERSIQAAALLRDIDPPIRYRIVGRTHPTIAARHGFVYRRLLEGLVDDLGVGHLVDFVDRYVSDEELFDFVRRSDVVVVPYDNHDQVSSGVITEAMGIGRPVVATRFPYSEELLTPGPGLVVDHDPESLAEAIRNLVEDPVSYRAAAEAAARLSARLSWSSVAEQYLLLIRELAPAFATA
jgi:glycosyltransferase involved in cell wall biosynthesis